MRRVSDHIKARSSNKSSESRRSDGRNPDTLGGIYVIHEPDAARHALRLDEALARTCAEPCHLKIPSSSEEMEGCLECVAQCTSVLLLQTKAVLTQPWALLAVYNAALARVPVVCVVVNESGYDFGGAKMHLEHLSERLGAPALEQISREMSRWDPPRDVEALQSKLSDLVPVIISVAYNPNGTDHELTATVRDVEDKQRILQMQRRISVDERPSSSHSAKRTAVATPEPEPTNVALPEAPALPPESAGAACRSETRVSSSAAAAMRAPPPRPAPPPEPTDGVELASMPTETPAAASVDVDSHRTERLFRPRASQRRQSEDWLDERILFGTQGTREQPPTHRGSERAQHARERSDSASHESDAPQRGKTIGRARGNSLAEESSVGWLTMSVSGTAEDHTDLHA
jgi:hypothetical protein